MLSKVLPGSMFETTCAANTNARSLEPTSIVFEIGKYSHKLAIVNFTRNMEFLEFVYCK